MQRGAQAGLRLSEGGEVLGSLLVLIPRTVTAGLALLACTMASAALILAFVIGRPGDSIFPWVFFVALYVFWLSRRRSA